MADIPDEFHCTFNKIHGEILLVEEESKEARYLRLTEKLHMVDCLIERVIRVYMAAIRGDENEPIDDIDTDLASWLEKATFDDFLACLNSELEIP